MRAALRRHALLLALLLGFVYSSEPLDGDVVDSLTAPTTAPNPSPAVRTGKPSQEPTAKTDVPSKPPFVAETDAPTKKPTNTKTRTPPTTVPTSKKKTPEQFAAVGSPIYKPHILTIVMDDLGSNDLGFLGSEIKTPVTDNLIKNGLFLKNFYTLPSCTTTRTALMTGRYPYSSGMFSKIGAYDTFGVSLDEAFLPQVLRTAGYQTHAVGKWHLGHSWRQFTPTYRGFQSFFGFLAGGAQGYFDHISETRRDGVVTAAYDMGWEPEEFCNETCSQIVDARGVYSSFLYADKAAGIIEKHDSAEGPLFLYLAYSAVHTPLEVPGKYSDMYEGTMWDNGEKWDRNRRVYAGMLTAADESLQTVIDALKARSMWADTLIIYQTDNGGSPRGASNYPRRGFKGSVWEGGIQGVGFLSGPALDKLNIPRGETSEHLFHTVDILPTLASMTNATLPDSTLDGVDQWVTLQGLGATREEAFLGYSDGTTNERDDHPLNGAYAALRLGPWKIVRYPDFKTYNLFHVGKDPSEKNDLASEMKPLLQLMKERLKLHESRFDSFDPEGQVNEDCTFDDVVFANTTWGAPAWQPWCNVVYENTP